MTKWEYCAVLYTWDGEESSLDTVIYGLQDQEYNLPDEISDTIGAVMAHLGSQGWEMVSVVSTDFRGLEQREYFFKRPVE